MGTKEKEQKTLNGIQSAVLLLLIVAAVAVCIRFKVGGPMIGLFFSWLIIYVFCIVLKIDYEHVKEGAYDDHFAGDRRSDRHLDGVRNDSYHHCVRFEIDQSGIFTDIYSHFYGGIKPGDWNVIRLRGQRRCGHDGDRQCYGNQSGNGRWSGNLRRHVR